MNKYSPWFLSAFILCAQVQGQEADTIKAEFTALSEHLWDQPENQVFVDIFIDQLPREYSIANAWVLLDIANASESQFVDPARKLALNVFANRVSEDKILTIWDEVNMDPSHRRSDYLDSIEEALVFRAIEHVGSSTVLKEFSDDLSAFKDRRRFGSLRVVRKIMQAAHKRGQLPVTSVSTELSGFLNVNNVEAQKDAISIMILIGPDEDLQKVLKLVSDTSVPIDLRVFTVRRLAERFKDDDQLENRRKLQALVLEKVDPKAILPSFEEFPNRAKLEPALQIECIQGLTDCEDLRALDVVVEREKSAAHAQIADFLFEIAEDVEMNRRVRAAAFAALCSPGMLTEESFPRLKQSLIDTAEWVLALDLVEATRHDGFKRDLIQSAQQAKETLDLRRSVQKRIEEELNKVLRGQKNDDEGKAPEF